MDFTEIANGSIIGNTATEIECNGLKEFYIIIKDAQTDSETKEYFDMFINDTQCKMFMGVDNHSWLYYWYWHCVKIGDYWILNKSTNLKGRAVVSGTSIPKSTNPIPINELEANKITIKFTGDANIVSGTYIVYGR